MLRFALAVCRSLNVLKLDGLKSPAECVQVAECRSRKGSKVLVGRVCNPRALMAGDEGALDESCWGAVRLYGGGKTAFRNRRAEDER